MSSAPEAVLAPLNRAGDSALLAAAQAGDVARLADLAHRLPPPARSRVLNSHANRIGKTALHLAAQAGHTSFALPPLLR